MFGLVKTGTFWILVGGSVASPATGLLPAAAWRQREGGGPPCDPMCGPRMVPRHPAWSRVAAVAGPI